MAEAFLIFYISLLVVLLLFSLVQGQLTLKSLRYEPPKAPALPADEALPRVTVQLPLYNEFYVAARLIDNIARLDYPHELLEVQVLDDSTDETSAVVAAKVAEWQQRGLNIHHLQRPQRQGYKAGALAWGLERAHGEFIAIFDADFLPEPDFLRKTLPQFHEPEVALVQARWAYLNEDYNLITRLQAFFLDAHFYVEHQGRSHAGYFFNFNGTGGVWRKAAIEDAGGWHSDTITEDLDLSYRAQLRGWRCRYVHDVTCPSELPVELNAVKKQQFRWTKGAAETSLKLLPQVLRVKMPFGRKLHAIFHLCNSSLFLWSFILVLLSVPFTFLRAQLYGHLNLDFLAIFGLCFMVLAGFYYTAAVKRSGGREAGIKDFLRHFPLFLAFSMALAWQNSRAVLEGYFGRKTEFVRTPKFNVLRKGDSWQQNRYMQEQASVSVPEAGLFLYFLLGVGGSVWMGELLMTPMFLLLSFGYGMLAFAPKLQLRQARKQQRAL